MTTSPRQDKRFRQMLDAAPDTLVVVGLIGIDANDRQIDLAHAMRWAVKGE